MGQTKHICRPNPVRGAPVNNLFQDVLAFTDSCLAVEIILKYQLFEDFYFRGQLSEGVWVFSYHYLGSDSKSASFSQRIHVIFLFPWSLFNLRIQKSKISLLNMKVFLPQPKKKKKSGNKLLNFWVWHIISACMWKQYWSPDESLAKEWTREWKNRAEPEINSIWQRQSQQGMLSGRQVLQTRETDDYKLLLDIKFASWACLSTAATVFHLTATLPRHNWQTAVPTLRVHAAMIWHV